MPVGDDDGRVLLRTRPPYVAFKAFKELVERAQREEAPDRIDAVLLAHWRIATGNESALTTSLKSLGIIDDTGRPTNDFRELRLGPAQRRAALRRCAKRAYPELDGAFDAKVDADQLRNYFVDRRALLGQMVDKATRFFRRLEEVVGAGSLALGSTDLVHRGAATSTVGLHLSDTGAPDLTLAITVEVPFGASEDELVAFFRRIQRAWQQAHG